jgi:Rps23 Pro-64 3,4-dihydroxylase Tpa1-like proline 4-hydroxylase
MSSAPWLDLAGRDPAALSLRWREAKPFPHFLLDDAFSPAHEAALLAAFEDEPCELLRDEIFSFLVSAKQPQGEAFSALRASWSEPDFLRLLGDITGKTLSRVELRGYAYQAGHYLLPHSDHQHEVGRQLAFAYYVRTPWEIAGGELELFSCVSEGGEIVQTTPAGRIAPIANRLVIFHVGDESLHQVCEVLAGTRLSVSGWFY